VRAVRALACVVALVACRTHAPPSNIVPAAPGLSIAIYTDGADSYAIVDDRRWVEVTGTSLQLPNLDAGADLASLVIEAGTLRVGTCTRETEVRCAVSASPGRYLIRLVYVTRTLGYRAEHDITLREPTRAAIASRFSVATPPWRTRADIALFDGVPGAARPLHEVARGTVMLDGRAATLGTSTRETTAQLHRIYEGAVITSAESSDSGWGYESVPAVWVWLELDGVRLAPGPIHIKLELPDEGTRAVDVATPSRRQRDDRNAPLRLPLWVDDSLRGSRQRVVEQSDGATLVERFQLAVSNSGDRDRVVFVDEPLRKATRRKVDRAWPDKPVVTGDRLRTKLVVKSGATERTGYTLTYDF
jgi:hypothetical protein